MSDARWAGLERRVAALEAAVGRVVEQAGQTDSDPSGPSSFWALDGLRPQARGLGAVVYAGTFRSEQGEVEWQYAHRVDDLLGTPDTPDVPVAADRDTDADAQGHAHALARAASRLAALGHPARLAILAAVLRGQDRTADLAGLLDLGTSGQVYHHVKALTAAGWLRPAARGQVAVPAERVIPLLVAIGAGS